MFHLFNLYHMKSKIGFKRTDFYMIETSDIIMGYLCLTFHGDNPNWALTNLELCRFWIIMIIKIFNRKYILIYK